MPFRTPCVDVHGDCPECRLAQGRAGGYVSTMQLRDAVFPEGQPVQGYGPGFFRIGDEVIRGGLLVLPGTGPGSWQGFDDLTAVVAASDRMDVLFVGTGAEVAHIPDEARALLETAGIGVEIMASPAACRTYNVLLSEGRRIGLAALPV